ncbi:protein KTI12 [Syncephalis pseudoplumigaleata]|uniref:Protein KTI12 n=1 Tax=Syncephalis pseudoplumigaleata TaxID=1712513 RepID=A0A4P9YWY1_9FUNG|nr:protein KTI12 [Syncephalis pseudoplumigaleata]|eukprot:RKP24556.1 protein KTI12 [Syncephalis pseudoplumigaleata]
MPLVILSGLPSSGKTTRAQVLLATKELAAESRPPAACDYRHTHMHACMIVPLEEKKARGALMSAVERWLNRDTIVVLDSLNYVKGFRYQLYCVARAMSTPHCVVGWMCCRVYCGTPTETARQWNQSRDAAQQYTPAIFDELAMRYEEPDAMRRWDAPLFVVTPEDEQMPLDDIWAALMLRKAPPPNMATAVKRVNDTNMLHALDRITQQAVDAVLQAQQEGVGTTAVALPQTDLKISFVPHPPVEGGGLPGRAVLMPELRRLRRQFIQINKAHTLPEDRVADAFVEYLNTNLH